MAISDIGYSARLSLVRSEFLFPATLVVCFLAAYTPTIMSLIDGPWQTEQEGHGPLIIAASLWLLWQSRDRLNARCDQTRACMGLDQPDRRSCFDVPRPDPGRLAG